MITIKIADNKKEVKFSPLFCVLMFHGGILKNMIG